MQNTLVFNQFDAVVSMTEATINDQLVHLLRTGTIRSSLILVQGVDSTGSNYVYSVLNDGDPIPPNCAYINGQIMPQISITESGFNVTFVLNFVGGTAYFWVGNGPLAKLKSFDMTGWAYGLSVNMDLYALEKKDIGSKIKVPDLVSNQLHNFVDNMFSVNSLFLDFESTNLLNFDPTKTNAGNSGDVGTQQLVLFMQFYIEWLISSGNPYVLGYAINVQDSSKVTTTSKVPDQLTFVGTDYTMFSDPVTATLSNLNFTLVSKGGFGHLSGSPSTFDTNWISSTEQCSGKMIIAHQDLLEFIFLEPLYASLQNGVYDQINGKVNVTAGNTYAQGRSNQTNGLHLNISNITTGDDQYQNYFDVSFTNNGASTDININGFLHIRKEVHQNDGVCQADAWADIRINWSFTITIGTAKDVNGNPTLTVSQSPMTITPSSDSHQNDCAKAIAVISKILGTILDLLSLGLDNGFFTNLLSKLMDTPIPNVGDVSVAFGNLTNSLTSTVLLPAGNVFYFKNPAFDNEGNFYLELTYISNQ